MYLFSPTWNDPVATSAFIFKADFLLAMNASLLAFSKHEWVKKDMQIQERWFACNVKLLWQHFSFCVGMQEKLSVLSVSVQKKPHQNLTNRKKNPNPKTKLLQAP